MDGSIRSREAKQVLADVLAHRKVPKAVYKFQGGKLNFMIGNRVVEFKCPPGLSFYALQQLSERLNEAVNEYENAKLRRNQLDLEDALRASA